MLRNEIFSSTQALAGFNDDSYTLVRNTTADAVLRGQRQSVCTLRSGYDCCFRRTEKYINRHRIESRRYPIVSPIGVS